jgi:hypothetical protein
LTMICLFVPFLLAIVLSVLQIMASDLPFRNFKLFLTRRISISIQFDSILSGKVSTSCSGSGTRHYTRITHIRWLLMAKWLTCVFFVIALSVTPVITPLMSSYLSSSNKYVYDNIYTNL